MESEAIKIFESQSEHIEMAHQRTKTVDVDKKSCRLAIGEIVNEVNRHYKIYKTMPSFNKFLEMADKIGRKYKE